MLRVQDRHHYDKMITGIGKGSISGITKEHPVDVEVVRLREKQDVQCNRWSASQFRIIPATLCPDTRRVVWCWGSLLLD